MNYKALKTKLNEPKNCLTVTFDSPPVNILGQDIMDDLNALCAELEKDRDVKVVVFQSANKDIFIAHYDIGLLKDLPTTKVARDKVRLLPLQKTLDRVSKLPQATIAKIQGMARGGGHEFALACDMRFADENAVFMQMEVGMGILPCGGGSSRMARQTGLGKALEIILSAKDFRAKEAEKYGTINKFVKSQHIDAYVDDLANRIAQFPSASIEDCKKMVYKSIDLSIDNALLSEAYFLYDCTSRTNAVERFKEADALNFQDNLENQRDFEELLMGFQD